MRGHEGTPWISVEVERAGQSDCPYGWIVTGRTPAHLACAPCMTWDDALAAATLYLNTAARRQIPTAFTKAEPLPPARRLEQ